MRKSLLFAKLTEFEENNLTSHQYDNGAWTQLSTGLNTPRRVHNSIVNFDEIWVIGGAGSNLPLEVCKPTETGIECTAQSATLSSYERYPELFLVPDDYCVPVLAAGK